MLTTSTGKVTVPRRPKALRTTPTGVMKNKKGLRNAKDVAFANVDAEFLYLRENEFTTFDPEIKLENLKVLDLSMNEIAGTVDFLPKTPYLRHLYMTGNRIDTLAGINGFAFLETLCLSDNAINGFEGLDNLPNLRVLSLNFNNIASFESYPTLPSLHTLNLVGNPITDVASYHSMAVAINCAELVSIDGKPVQSEERAAVEHYQGKVVHCIREGFIVEGDDGDVEDAASKYLLERQRAREKARPLRLCSIHLLPTVEGQTILTEGSPVKLSMCMQDIRQYEQRKNDIFHSRYLYPVIFKVSGEATEVLVVGSMNEWADPIVLERCELDGEIFFHTTLYLPAGDYEYRYIVDGVEKVSEANRHTSKHKQGYCNIYHVVELDSMDDEQNTILYIRWMRSGANNIFELIDNENTLTYTPSAADVGYCLRAEVLAYINGDYSFLYFDISTPIVAGQPTCPHLEIKGEPVEGTILTVEADYIGGKEGNSSLSWFRVVPEGEEVPIDLEDPWTGYEVTVNDIGCQIKAVFTPLRADWVAGVPRAAVTAEIGASRPECRKIKITGNLVQGSELEAVVAYIGGVEGPSRYQWLRKDEETNDFYPIEGETSTTYTPLLEDVGKCLAVEYMPVNQNNEEGDTYRCVLEKAIEPADPKIVNLTIEGTFEEQHVLVASYEYYGGTFGHHMIEWYRCDKKRHVTKIGRANSNTYSLTVREVDCTIEVTITPVRSDGVQGEPVTTRSTEVVRASVPQIKYFNIEGEPVVGQTVDVQVEYAGGEPGEAHIEWSREVPGTQSFEIVSEGSRKYQIAPEDVGRMLKVTYTPVRRDGVEGEPKSRIIQVPRGNDASDRHVDPVPARADSEDHNLTAGTPQFVTADEYTEYPPGGADNHFENSETDEQTLTFEVQNRASEVAGGRQGTQYETEDPTQTFEVIDEGASKIKDRFGSEQLEEEHHEEEEQYHHEEEEEHHQQEEEEHHQQEEEEHHHEEVEVEMHDEEQNVEENQQPKDRFAALRAHDSDEDSQHEL